MNRKSYCVVSGCLFALVSLVHLIRLIKGVPIQFGSHMVPMSGSIAGFIVAGFLSVWGFRSTKEL